MQAHGTGIYMIGFFIVIEATSRMRVGNFDLRLIPQKSLRMQNHHIPKYILGPVFHFLRAKKIEVIKIILLQILFHVIQISEKLKLRSL